MARDSFDEKKKKNVYKSSSNSSSSNKSAVKEMQSIRGNKAGSSSKSQSSSSLSYSERINQKSYGTTRGIRQSSVRSAQERGRQQTKYYRSFNQNQQENMRSGSTTRRATFTTTASNRNREQQNQTTATARANAQADQERGQNRTAYQRLEEDRIRREKESKERRAQANKNLNLKQAQISKAYESTSKNPQDLIDAQAQKSGVYTDSLKEKQAKNKEKLQKTGVGRFVGNAADRWVETEKGILASTGTALADIGEMASSGKTHSKGRLSQDMAGLLPQREKLKQSYRDSYLDYKKYRDDIEKKKQGIKGDAKGLEKYAYSAEESFQGMLSDWIAGTAMGGRWEIPLALRTYGQSRGTLEAEGATAMEDRLNAAKDAFVEVMTEKMGGFMGAAKLAPAKKKLFKPFSEKIEGALMGRLGGGVARDIASGAVRGARNILEESLEEWIANPAENWGENKIFRNRQQAEREAEHRGTYNALADEIQAYLSENPGEVDRYIAEVNSNENREELIKNYMEGGMTEAQAASAADKSIEFMVAAAEHDTDRMNELVESLGDDLVGDVRKKVWDWNENIDSFISTALMMGVTSAGNTVTATQQGMAIKNAPNGTEQMKKALRKVAEFDGENASKAQALLDKMDNGYEPTASQAYDIMQDENKVMAESRERQAAATSIKAKGIKREDLRIAPAIENEDGAYEITGDVTAQKYEQDYVDTMEYAEAAIKSSKESKLDMADAEVVATAVASYKAGTLTVAEIAGLTVENPEARYIFQEMTGENLNDYNVYGKGGKIDAVKSNINMQEKLLAKAAQNYIQSARVEQENWNDVARGKTAEQIAGSFSKNGNPAVLVALDAVDPRDPSQLMTMGSVARDVYRYSWNTQDSWEDTKAHFGKTYKSLNVDALQGVYEAAKEDRAEQENDYINAYVESGQTMGTVKDGTSKGVVKGNFVNETPFNPEDGTGRDFKATELIVVEETAKAFNVDIIQVAPDDKRLEHEEGAYGQAAVNFRNREIYISNEASVNEIVHEAVHLAAKLDAPQYLDMAHYIMDTAYKHDPEGTQQLVDRFKKLYKGQNLTDVQVEEEVVAALVSRLGSDPAFAKRLAEGDPQGFKQKIISVFDNILRALRNIVATGHIKNASIRDAFLNEIGALQDTRDMMLRFYDEAAKAQASQDINDKQDEMNARSDTKYALMQLPDGRRFVEVEAEQSRFDNASSDEYVKIARDIINQKFNGQVIGVDNPAFINSKGRNEYLHPSKHLAADEYEAKLRASAELDNIVDAGMNNRNVPDGQDGHFHPDVVGGYDHSDTLFKIGNRWFEGRVNIKNNKIGRLFGDVTKIKDVTQDIMSSYGKNPKSQFLRTSSMRKISSQEDEVKNSLSDSNMTVQGNTARWTDNRIDSLIREYGARNNDEYSKAWAVMMSPEDFLKLTLSDETLQKWEENPNEEIYDLDEEELRNQQQTPFLVIDGRESVGDLTYRIDGHEGRHRMRALMRAGVTSVPVVLRETQVTKYSKTSISEMNLAAQDFGYDPINDDARVTAKDLVPIKESNRDELIEKFGGEADVRFSITPQQDADYMKAVESGDMETAQRMVDEAAEAAMPNSILREGGELDIYTGGTEEGKLIKMYHGSGAKDFYEFRLNEGALGKGAYFTSSPEEATEYAIFASDEINENDDWQYEWDDTTYDSIGEIGEELEKQGYVRAFYLDITDSNDLNLSPGLLYAVARNKSQIKSADPVTYDDNGEVIPLSKRFDMENPDVRFSLNAPVERVKDLVAVHNLKEDDVRNTWKLGGFPMPSIAVIKASMGHDMYGPISFLFHSNTIDPQKNRSNEVFGGDAYTPTFPAIKFKPNKEVADKIQDLYYDMADKYSYDEMRGLYGLAEDLENQLNADGGEQGLIDRYKTDTRLMQTFLTMNDKKVEDVVTRKEETLTEAEIEFNEHLIKALGEDLVKDFEAEDVPHGKEMIEHRKKWMEENRDKLEEAYVDILKNDYGFNDEQVENTLISTKNLDYMKFMRDVASYRKNGTTTVTETKDTDATNKAIEKAAKEAGYEEWLTDLLTGVEAGKGIRNNKEFFTRQGNRRSWDTLHDPITLNNVVKVMKDNLSAGANGLIGANPKGAAQKKYKNLDEIRSDEDRLQNLPQEEYKQLEENALQHLQNVIEDIIESNPRRFDNQFGAVLDTGTYIAEILNETRDKAKFKEILKEYSINATDSQMDALMDVIDEIANLPTGYFEAKPRRGVGLNEIKAAIIPTDASQDIMDMLNEQGIEIVEYDPEIEGDRTAKLNEAADRQDIKFSLNSEGEELSQGQETFFERSKNRNAEGQLKVMLHGTDADFTEFDPSKAKPGTLGRAFYFSDSASHAGQYGNVGRYYLNLENPLMGNTHDITKDQLRKFVAYLAENEDYGIENYGADATVDSVTDSVWGGTDFVMLRDLNLSAVGDFAEAVKVFNRVNGTDYDGIITEVETAAFYPEQIKRTDNLNPTLNKDTRYSITDADGKTLSDGQVKYFRNSQARDEQGRLVRVFHTTNRGGFTIFDPSFSDDRRSLFFASNFDVSQTYGSRAYNKIRLNDAEIKTLDDAEKWAIAQFPQYDLEGFDDVRTFVEDRFHMVILDPSLGDDTYERYLNLKKGIEEGRINPDEYKIRVTLKPIDRFRDSMYEMTVSNFVKTIAEAANNLSQKGYYECYLNLENPLIVDAHGDNWNAIHYTEGGNDIRDDASERIDSIIIDHEYGFDDELIGINLTVFGEFKNEDGEWEEFQQDFSLDSPIQSDNLEEIQEALNNELYDTWSGYLYYDESILTEIIEQYVDKDGNVNAHVDMFLRNGEKLDRDDYDTGTYITRDLAEMAQARGHDGVIIKNCVDIGGASYFRGEDEMSDIYIAFNSNQVKDINNENPTENPDIRYSITPEDEALSRIAYEAAMDNSYEALVRYENRIEDTDADTFYAKPFKEEDIAEFYAGLQYDEAVVYSDPVLEEDRVRMARSKADFFNNLNAKWNDRWTTEGRVLDIKSVKTDIRNLVMGVMANSDTNAKYKTELVNKTLIDIKNAYQLMKQDRQDVAAALLYHSAQRMIDGVEFYVDDGTFDRYKEIRDYFRTTRISLDDRFWDNELFLDLRKQNFGRMKLVKGRTNVDQVYQELAELFPEYFDAEEMMAEEDMLEQMAHVLDIVQPYKEAYTSEAAAELAFDIADSLYDIMEGGKEYASLADTYKQRFDAKTKAMKQRHAEAMLRMRRQTEEGVQAERAKWRAREEARKERTQHKTEFEKIQKNYDWLKERLITNTADRHIPEQYKKELAKLLMAFDLQTVGSKKRQLKTGRASQGFIKMAQLKATLNQIEQRVNSFQVNDAITDLIDQLASSVEGKTIDELSSSELNQINELLKALKHEFVSYENVRIADKQMKAAEIGKAQVDSALEHAKMFGPGKDLQNMPGVIDKIINLDEMTPAYMFRRVDADGTGLGLMWKEIRRSFDKYVRNQNQLNDWMADIVGEYHNKGVLWNKYGSGELTNWRSDNYSKTFNLTNGTVKLTPAQMMSLYCLSKRGQAYQHMVGAGVVVAPVSFNAKMLSDVKKKINKALPVQLTDADIKQIVAELTPEQLKVADKLQELMNTKMADWGNEASMDVIGIELFKEENYFPIKSDEAALKSELTNDQFVQAIMNFGFAKAVQPGARNAIMIEDIFDVVTEHCNNMNLYNAYSASIKDFMKVYNYRDFREDGSEYTVKQAVAHAYSSKATTFIMTFLKDLNGNVSGRASGIEDAYNTLLGNAKKAAVFANLRVAAQQPTALTRAFMVIDPKYIKGIKVEKGAMTEMFEHCPIALWKSWGYYDINMGKSIEDIMMNNGRWLEDKATDLYGALDNVTWTAIWQMVKNEMKDTHPDVEIGTEEYWELCNERMTEIVDLTQVVDSPMHRSHAMRDKGFLKKMATSFMAEPTLTFNMIRDGWVRAAEAKKAGNMKEASKILSRTIAVALLQAASVAGAAALVDALRNKNPNGDDDEEDESFLHLWWVNAVENFQNELKVWNKVYFIKDIASIFEGWENANLALQGIQKFALGWRQLKGDKYARSSASWYENMADGLGYMFGVPVKTMRTGISNAMQMFGLTSPIIDELKENLDAISFGEDKDGAESEGFSGNLFGIEIKGDGLLGKLLSKAETEEEEPAESAVSKEELAKKYPNLSDEELDEIVKAGNKRASKSSGETGPAEMLSRDEMLAKALKASAGLEGEAKDKKIYNAVSHNMKEHIANGDYDYIARMRGVIMELGGDVDYFDKQVLKNSKSEFKKSLNPDMSKIDLVRQHHMHNQLIRMGMTDEQISSEILYKSDLAKDLKVAFRLNNEEFIGESLEPLMWAGITQEDLNKLYENRNKMKLDKYEGKYKDQLKSTGTFNWPVEGTITSVFGNRNSPGGIGSTNHQAIDIAAPTGTPVGAADGGTVIYVGWNGGYGNSVGIKHDDGRITYYNHLSGYCVNEGDVVGQGQEVGQVGSTGNSTGPHLDFKVLDAEGNPIDPMQFLDDTGKDYDLSA